MTAEQKETISAILSLGSLVVGATTGSVTDMVVSGVAGSVAVEENKFSMNQAIEAHKSLYKQCVAEGYKDCNKMHIMPTNADQTDWRVEGCSFIDKPTARDMITNSAFNVPDYITVNTPLGGATVNLYNANLYLNTPAVGSSRGGSFSLIGGSLRGNSGSNSTRSDNVDSFLGGFSFTSGGSIGGPTYTGTNISILQGPSDTRKPSVAIEHGFSTPVLDVGSVGYSQQITGEN